MENQQSLIDFLLLYEASAIAVYGKKIDKVFLQGDQSSGVTGLGPYF